VRQLVRILVAACSALLVLTVGTTARAEIPLPPEAVWPLDGPVSVVRAFDPPAEQWGRGHRGVDLAGSVGAPVRAAADGRITYAASLAGRGVVVVDHGGVRTTHEPVTAAVAVGTRVSAGTVIGRLAAGSHCAQPCLHWGLIEGNTYRDPLNLILADAHVRLLPASAREAARQHAAAREAATERATAAGGIGEHAPFDGRVSDRGLLRPVAGPVTSPFGRRFHPIRHVWKLHDGTDFGAPCGTPIRAAADGRVVRRFFNSGYGNRLMIDHGTLGGRGIVTGYNHATRYVVGVGDIVRRGQTVGYVGSTGLSTGCHLHLMLWVNGGLSNPMGYF
jgi:murein DD-endopeptidase MepM/ murein hydrolase activator NlpD